MMNRLVKIVITLVILCFLSPLTNTAKTDEYSIPKDWQYQETCDKDFWLVVYYPYEYLETTGLANEPFLNESIWKIPPSIIKKPDSKAYQELLAKKNPVMLYFEHIDLRLSPFLKDFGERYVASWGHCAEYTNPGLKWWINDGLNEEMLEEMLKTRKGLHELLAKTIKARNVPSKLRGHKLLGINTTIQDHFSNTVKEIDIPGPEIATSSVWCAPMQIIFARAASRQFQKPWMSYISSYRGSHLSFDVIAPWCRNFHGNSAFSPWCGTSISLQERMLYLSYMGGANFIWLECDQPRHFIFLANYDYRTVNEIDPLVLNLQDKKLYPSPIFHIYRRFYDGIVKKHNRGISWTPIGLLFDQYHGHMQSYEWNLDYILGGPIHYKDADYMGRAIINTLYPWEEIGNEEVKTMVAEPLTGDIFDVITNISSLKTLSDYPVLFLSGNVDVDKEFADKLISYVKKGGRLYLNTEQIINAPFSEEFLGCRIEDEVLTGNSFFVIKSGLSEKEKKPYTFRKVIPTTAKTIVTCPDSHPEIPLVLENSYGKGKVILTTPYFLYVKGSKFKMLNLFSFLIKEEARRLLPFELEINGKVEYLVNKTKKSWIITFLNNKVYKARYKEEVVKEEDTARITITFKKGIKFASASEWIEASPVVLNKRGRRYSANLEVPAGKVRIVEFKEMERRDWR